jgi:hypothetical protein
MMPTSASLSPLPDQGEGGASNASVRWGLSSSPFRKPLPDRGTFAKPPLSVLAIAPRTRRCLCKLSSASLIPLPDQGEGADRECGKPVRVCPIELPLPRERPPIALFQAPLPRSRTCPRTRTGRGRSAIFDENRASGEGGGPLQRLRATRASSEKSSARLSAPLATISSEANTQ